MPEIVLYTMTVLCVITQDVTIGTNLALLHFMWMLVSGSLSTRHGQARERPGAICQVGRFEASFGLS